MKLTEVVDRERPLVTVLSLLWPSPSVLLCCGHCDWPSCRCGPLCTRLLSPDRELSSSALTKGDEILIQTFLETLNKEW